MTSRDLDAPTARPSYLCGLIGTGISKSLTPPLHEAEGRVQGVGYVYRILDLDTLGVGVEGLPQLLSAAKLLGSTGSTSRTRASRPSFRCSTTSPTTPASSARSTRSTSTAGA